MRGFCRGVRSVRLRDTDGASRARRGKRFAVEQELVAASARAAAKDMQLEKLKGRHVALYVTVMGDEGSGTFVGGRYTIDALIRGDYVSSPVTKSDYTYPVIDTTATTTTDGYTTVTAAANALNAPKTSRARTVGQQANAGIGVNANGLGEYKNETLITNPRDVTFLTNLLQTAFFLRGVDVVSPAQADTDVFVTVDVFGTIRDRTDWQVANVEELKAQTKLEMFAVDKKTRDLVLKPRTSSFEAKYDEQYYFWCGPFTTAKAIRKADPLLVDFGDMDETPQALRTSGATMPFVPAKEEAPRDPVSDAIKKDRR